MNFNQESTQLAVISNKQTLHIFQIDESQPFNKSVVSLRLYNPTIRNSKELFHSGDKCELIWNDNDQTLILIWLNYRIWIRYIIIYDKNINKFELIRESWRQLS